MTRYSSQEYAREQIKGTVIEKIDRVKYNKGSQTWIAKGMEFDVQDLKKNHLNYSRPDKNYGIQWLSEVFPEAVQRILAGETITYEDQQKLKYYEYLKAHLHPVCFTEGYNWNNAERHIWKKMNDLIRLCRSVRDEGLSAPLDMFLDKDKYMVLTRGYRRLEILSQLGIKKVPVRLWRTEWLAQHFIPTSQWQVGSDNVHGTAVKQFIKRGFGATDKYWVHGYTPYYDIEMQGRYKEKLKILELGVYKGMSIRMWKEAFPNAEVYGIDKKIVVKDMKRVTLLEGDENDLGFLKEIGKKYGPFDLIVDDALHLPKPQRNSFKALWPYLASNGVYAVEDLHPNYADKHKIEGTKTMDIFKKSIDKIWENHEVKGVSFHPNICFIRKA